MFDAVVAVDAGVQHIFRHGGVAPENVRDLVYGTIFARSPADLNHTAIFIGGSNVPAGEAILDEIKKTFFGPFRVSVLFDGNGSNTTAAAAVLTALQASGGSLGRYWDHPVPRSLTTHHSTGRPSEWDEDARAILSGTLHQPPDHFGYQATGWTVPLLQTHLALWGLTDLSDATLRRQLHALGYVWKRPRYVLVPDPRRAAKMRRIRQYIKGLGPRDVFLFEDETDLLLFPPLRACWARPGEDAEVPLYGANAKRVIFGALNISSGTQLFLEREKQCAADFQEFLGLIHEHYRGWHVSLRSCWTRTVVIRPRSRNARRACSGSSCSGCRSAVRS